MPDAEERGQPVIAVPERGLVLLVGASGAGKSTFARRHFGPTEILSSDAFRALVCDDEADQAASAPAFELLHRALALRLRFGRLSVVDATNAGSRDRRPLLHLAAAARRPAVAIVIDPGESLCLARNAARDGRIVLGAVVRRQWAAVRTSIADPARLLAEGFAAIHVLDDATSIDSVNVVRDPSIRPAAVTPAAGGARPGAASAARGAASAIRRRRAACARTASR